MKTLTLIGSKKIQTASSSPLHYFMKALMGGLYLGVAMILSYTLGGLFYDTPAISKLFVAFSFGIGIIVILFLGAELFTGNCLSTIVALYKKECTFKQLLPSWILCYLGNAIGMIIMGILFVWTQTSNEGLNAYIQPLYESKLNFIAFDVLIKAILCNFIVCMCSYIAIKVENEAARVIIILFLIAAFVLPGFEHCIANFGVFTIGMMKFGSAIDISNLALHTLISTIGNIIGGSIMFATPIYFMLKHEEAEQ